MTRQILFALRLFITAFLIAAMALLVCYTTPAAASRPTNQQAGEWLRDTDSDGFVYYADGGRIACRPATPDEARAFAERDPFLPLKVITPRANLLGLQEDEGLNIILRGTPQLDNFPQAKEAFLRAAANWRALVRANITVIIDVDFGPTRFGQPFPQGVLGSASSQSLGRDDFYSDIRNALIAGSGNAEELALYNSLPGGSVLTDIGNTTRVFAPSAALRAMGLIDSVADPDAEQQQFGPPPSIGFNSAPGFQYDFDPRDGITPGQVDFEATAAHEIGHTLGFTSFVGARELNPNGDVAMTVWDLFRFQRGAAVAAHFAPANFSTAERMLSSGGDQVFFAGGPELSLSTGRPDGSGGDGFQASHWKDDSLFGAQIGVMDPVIRAGERGEITENDLAVLNTIGYGTNEADEGGPDISKATFNGAKMVIKGKGLSGNLELEVNFEIVAPPLRIKAKPSGKKLKITGNQDELNLHPGANQVRVIKDGLRLKVVVLNL
ncbi:MAG: NF038122 family metalloprotease [Blastocatellia bacterium]|nr:NF038122 family metalloprotease [Blastocatellia bacterium]